MLIFASILPLVILSVFAQGDDITDDPLTCVNHCKLTALVSSPALENCVDSFDLPCTCKDVQYEAVFALCLKSTCQSILDVAAQYRREECATATQTGVPSNAPPASTTPLLSSLIDGLTNTRNTVSTTGAVSPGSATPRPTASSTERICSHHAALYTAIFASSVILVLYVNGFN